MPAALPREVLDPRAVTPGEDERTDAWGVDQQPRWSDQGSRTSGVRLAVASLLMALVIGIVLFIGMRAKHG
jgi:hypothetical protein